MDHEAIKEFLESFALFRDRTIVIVDFGNVEKWKESLGWKIGIKELGHLVRYFTQGKKFLRRFYYGSDFGPNEKFPILQPWSAGILQMADVSGFEVVTKPVKYIHSQTHHRGFEVKCDLDVEMTVDLIRERENYDNIVLFSGDGDLVYAIKFLNEIYQKQCIVFGARNHIGREVIDAKKAGVIGDIYYAEDFEYRLSMGRRH